MISDVLAQLVQYKFPLVLHTMTQEYERDSRVTCLDCLLVAASGSYPGQFSYQVQVLSSYKELEH